MITFFSNFINEHQIPFCENMYKKTGGNFRFVATEPFMDERLAMGFEDRSDSFPYVVKSYEDDKSFKEALNKAANFRSSGALTLNFVCNANEMANHFEWAIANGNSASQADFRSAFVLFEKEINSYLLYKYRGEL